MSKDVDWTGPWPPLVFAGGFYRWAQRKLLLGLTLAAVVSAVVVGTAAKMAGHDVFWLATLAVTFVAVLSLREWSGATPPQGHPDGR